MQMASPFIIVATLEISLFFYREPDNSTYGYVNARHDPNNLWASDIWLLEAPIYCQSLALILFLLGQ